MSITGIGSSSSLLVQALTSMRSQLDDLQRQLGTGSKSTNYAGLGLDRGLVVGLRNHLSAISSYADTTTNVNLRINLQQTTLTRIATINGNVKAASQTNFSIDASGQTVGQHSANAQFDEILNALNTQAGDRYLFSGRATNKPAAESSDVVLNGDVLRAGFKQVMSERNQADLGANGLGRLLLPPTVAVPATLTGAGATLAPDAAATVAGSQNLSFPYTSAGGTLSINGTNVTINPGDDVTAVLAAINAPAVVAATGVTATAPGGLLTLTSADADTSVDLTGSTGSLIGEFGIAAGPTAPTNLLTQGAVTAGQQLTVTVGGNPQYRARHARRRHRLGQSRQRQHHGDRREYDRRHRDRRERDTGDIRPRRNQRRAVQPDRSERRHAGRNGKPVRFQARSDQHDCYRCDGHGSGGVDQGGVR